ncbi:MMPL family transporter [Nocardiopsis mangrovi]|uniref:MMPL family transporter n=1 Tax=Nocardiopsis mangrovi TaxID=1179818 RepID=A0ABV9DT90_9ACTN
MFTAWSVLVHRLRWAVIAVTLAVAVPAGMWGAGVAGELSDGGLSPSGTESAQVADLTAQHLAGVRDVVLLYRGGGGYGDPTFDDAVRASLRALPGDAVRTSMDPWSAAADRRSAEALVSRDRDAVLVPVRLDGATEDEKSASLAAVRAAAGVAELEEAGVDLAISGETTLRAEFREQAMHDLARAELIAFPLLLAVLVWVFGSVTAAVLPLAVGAVAVAGSVAGLRLIALSTEVSTFALNVVTMIGLGLAVDYALFMVSRFREELGAGRAVPAALTATLRTAGRTVAVSGLIIGISFSGLLVFDLGALRSIGVGGIAATFLAMAAALTVLPALLAVLGTGVDRLAVGRRGGRAAATRAAGPWARLAGAVMARPARCLTASAAVLALLGAPFLHVHFSTSGPEVLPEHSEARGVAESLDRDFPGARRPMATVVVTGLEPGPGADTAVADFAARVRAVPGVAGAEPLGRDRHQAAVLVESDAAPKSEEARDLVLRLRALPPPDGARTLVGGETAELIDTLASLRADLPAMAAVVAAVTVVLLFAAFGSIVLPLKALVVGAASLTACFGVVVWAVQDGHLAGVLGFTTPPGTDPAVMILIAAIAFGLSMDYEVFLLGRVREEWLRTGDGTAAVAAGMQRTSGLITRAALLLVVVLGAMATADVLLVATVGIGLVAAVVIDATLVRAVLVPAAMRLMGAANWWLPRPLAALHRRIGVVEPAAGPEHPRAPDEAGRTPTPA